MAHQTKLRVNICADKSAVQMVATSIDFLGCRGVVEAIFKHLGRTWQLGIKKDTTGKSQLIASLLCSFAWLL
jgi:hypothetical protein